MLSETKTCSRCGDPLGRDVGSGVCASCLLAGALTLEANNLDAIESSECPWPKYGDYELQEEIGRGGMGVVYKARERNLDRIVALKMLLAGEFADAKAKDRLLREARISSRLAHPGIVTIFEVGEHGGQPYFAMEYVAGQNLANLCRERRLPPAKAACYVEKLARAVQYAHEQGVVHRDLKPANVLIGANDEPKLTDFGLTKSLIDPTRTVESAGSPGFMAPEQADNTFDLGSGAGDHSWAFSVGGDGSLWVGGAFQSFNEQSASRLA